jgi:hypothetical protein
MKNDTNENRWSHISLVNGVSRHFHISLSISILLSDLISTVVMLGEKIGRYFSKATNVSGYLNAWGGSDVHKFL